MVTIQTDVDDDCDGKRKFSFSSVKKKLKNARKFKISSDKKSPTKKKFSFSKLFRRKEKEPEVEFTSGYGELLSRVQELSQHEFSCVRNFIDLTTSRKKMRKWKIDFYVDRVI